MIQFVMGMLAVILVIKLLKRIIKAPRPRMFKGSTFGMPSTRAGISFFVVVYLMLLNKSISINTMMILFVLSLIPCALKYIMEEHSLMQLLVGGVIGSMVAYFIHKI